MRKIKVLSVFGTRPDAVKMCPLVKKLESDERFISLTCVSAQHREMLDMVTEIFNVKPDYDLNVMRPRQSLFDITANVLRGFEKVLADAKPDVVLVHGDTSTAFVAALGAFYMQIPVGHVEAGLRTGNIYSPFPEEMNRLLADRISVMDFAPTKQNRENLIRENAPGKIYVTGNTVIDAMAYTVSSDYKFENPSLEWALQGNKPVFMTAHRRENIGEPLENICRAVRRFADDCPDARIVYAVHLNPAVREIVHPILSGHDRIRLTDPVGLRDAHNFMSHCRFVLTDSGGIQEEATALGVPTLVLRRETERGEGVKTGILKLVGTDEENIYRESRLLYENDEARAKMSSSENPYGDGNACGRIADAIYEYLGGITK